ncbi:MAG: hypothetical protein HN416_16110 [Nitrospina sp.]|nr:hypothetical protein [Nitrospina sp.]
MVGGWDAPLNSAFTSRVGMDALKIVALDECWDEDDILLFMDLCHKLQ